MQNITPPPEIKEAMDKQMIAERNKRATILEAQATKIVVPSDIASITSNILAIKEAIETKK